MYVIYFEYGNQVYQLPINPEQIEITNSQAVEKYEILKLGQVAVPTHMELKEYSFECELPKFGLRSNDSSYFGAAKYLHTFETWRKELVPIRFIAGLKMNEFQTLLSNFHLLSRINTLVLIEEMTVTEKAGEEGDFYVSFKLLEYREFSNHTFVDDNGKKKKSSKNNSNPKNTGYYTVKKGDTLWSIAKKYYGDGKKYTKIYYANKDKIRNPALIYPGWKLVIP